MIFTKTEIEVLKLFTSKIKDTFTIRETARLIKKDVKIVHTSVKRLIMESFLIKEKHNGLRLNLQKNMQDLAYIENLRKELFYRRNPLLKAYFERFIFWTKQPFFCLLVFGSYADNTNKEKSDVDILLLTDGHIVETEKEFIAKISTIDLPTHVTSLSCKEFIDLLKRKELNLAAETLNKHIIIYGAESYYKMLGEI